MVLIFLFFVIAIIFLPQWWAKRIFAKYSEPQQHIQGTGGELARHLLDRFKIDADVESLLQLMKLVMLFSIIIMKQS